MGMSAPNRLVGHAVHGEDAARNEREIAELERRQAAPEITSVRQRLKRHSTYGGRSGTGDRLRTDDLGLRDVGRRVGVADDPRGTTPDDGVRWNVGVHGSTGLDHGFPTDHDTCAHDGVRADRGAAMHRRGFEQPRPGANVDIVAEGHSGVEAGVLANGATSAEVGRLDDRGRMNAGGHERVYSRRVPGSSDVAAGRAS